MKESHRKDLASHPDPESCMDRCREAAIEALTGAQAGRAIELRNLCAFRVPTVFCDRKAPSGAALARAGLELCAVQAPGMSGHSTRENRETRGLPVEGSRVGPRAGRRRR